MKDACHGQKNKDVSSAEVLNVELRPSLKRSSYLYILKTKESQELDLLEHQISSPFQEEMYPLRPTLN